MVSFKCRDIGMSCPFEAEERTEEKLLKKIEVHAKKVHGMNEISPELMTQIKSVIKKS
jgi:predicted small metal-binding protein